MSELVDLFEALDRPAAGSDPVTYCARTISGTRHRLGKNVEAQPALLLTTDAPPNAPPFTLEHLSIRHGVRCRLYDDRGDVTENTVSIVQCVGGDRFMHAHFLRAAGSVVLALGDAPTPSDLGHAFSSLVALFRAMGNAPRKGAQGLWAELFLVAGSNDPDLMIRGWHASPEELFDFAHGDARLEVKSSGDRTRRHFFRLEQLSAPAPVRILVASVLVAPLGGGVSIGDLVEEIRGRMRTTNNILRLERLVSETLGKEWSAAIAAKFDRELARTSLSFFEPGCIPAPPSPMPTGVSEVRFRSDLEGIQPCLPETIDTNDLFRVAAAGLARSATGSRSPG